MKAKMPELTKRLRITDIRQKKQRGEKIAMLTAYDATMAQLIERAGIEIILVGDSLGMVIQGEETTLGVTLDVMIHHTRAVSRGAQRAIVVADMPFLTSHADVPEAVRNVRRVIQEGGAAAVKIEGCRPVLDVVRRLVDIGVPVMGHLGLLPQSVHAQGGLGRQATLERDADQLVTDAHALEQAGIFSLVLESIPAELARRVTAELEVPTIGIGAGPHCDGQVLVSYDVFGLFDRFVPPFVRQYAKLGDEMVRAAQEFAGDVRDGRFPSP